jgi:enoyl-CoA hydratase
MIYAKTYETLLYEVNDRVATITLNRPRMMNALSAQAFDDLEETVAEADSNDAVRVLLITGAGDKAFAAGADINELARTDASTGAKTARRGQEVMTQIEICRKPVIALINGFALGGGCELAMACTMRIASDRAKLGQPEIKLGIIPGYGGTQRLPKLVGSSRALRLMLTGEMIDAQEALRIGLVDEVVAAENLAARGLELASAIANAAPLAVSGCLEAVRRGARLPLSDAMKVEADIFGRLCGTEDKTEGTTAFLEKRTLTWKGR